MHLLGKEVYQERTKGMLQVIEFADRGLRYGDPSLVLNETPAQFVHFVGRPVEVSNLDLYGLASPSDACRPSSN